MKKILLILALLSAPILVQAQYEAGRRSAVERTDVRERYTPGLGINVGTMGKDLAVGVTVHNFIQEKYLFNVYGSWDYRFFGYQSCGNTRAASGWVLGQLKASSTSKNPFIGIRQRKSISKASAWAERLISSRNFPETPTSAADTGPPSGASSTEICWA
ncbi:hypothetical protein SAMN02745150_01382 [Brevinema andersonii]|uniref:Outer membrane protein beta-barrel domain-containing protein n=1 Tax=Brevinema andersonii TaxID=34097 RepID=A0A1I1F7L7_BREAD|nr:hypothetical protein [Brevinema andersonii]SFB93698.1 hypothetical protein SAMN02745150_01382 [Brevinema andersonii]